MTQAKGIAPHETFELHELLTFKNVCATKSATMSALVKDDVLKSLLQQDFIVAQGHIRELQSLIQKSTFMQSGNDVYVENTEKTARH